MRALCAGLEEVLAGYLDELVELELELQQDHRCGCKADEGS